MNIMKEIHEDNFLWGRMVDLSESKVSKVSTEDVIVCMCC